MTRAQATAAAIHKALPEMYMFGNHYWNGAKVTSIYRLVMSNLFLNIFCISFAKHVVCRLLSARNKWLLFIIFWMQILSRRTNFWFLDFFKLFFIHPKCSHFLVNRNSRMISYSCSLLSRYSKFIFLLCHYQIG